MFVTLVTVFVAIIIALATVASLCTLIYVIAQLPDSKIRVTILFIAVFLMLVATVMMISSAGLAMIQFKH